MTFMCSTCTGPTRTYRTVPHARHIIRYRRCKNCNATFTTVELTKKFLDSLSPTHAPNQRTTTPKDHVVVKSEGQLAYEADCTARPLYHDGTPRKAWEQLDEISRRSWCRKSA